MSHFFLEPRLSFQSLSRVQLLRPTDGSLPGSSVHGDFPGKNTGVAATAFCRSPVWCYGIRSDRDKLQVLVFRELIF